VTESHFIYVADPMCSWCYAFAPVVSALEQQFRGRLAMRVITGGLRAGNTQAMRPQDRDYIRDAWTRVNAASGQPFDFSFFERDHFVYDSEPPCRAVVTMRAMDPTRELAFMSSIQSAFYAQNRDITSGEVLADVAAEEGHDRTAFLDLFQSTDIRNATFRDFLTAQEMGIRGFPVLVVGSKGAGYALVTNGFRPLEGLPEAVEDWLQRQAAT
jgi:putative protein-disulfide isomerase